MEAEATTRREELCKDAGGTAHQHRPRGQQARAWTPSRNGPSAAPRWRRSWPRPNAADAALVDLRADAEQYAASLRSRSDGQLATAGQEAESLLNAARTDAEALLATAREEAQSALTSGQSDAAALVAAARAEAEALVAAARTDSDTIAATAEALLATARYRG